MGKSKSLTSRAVGELFTRSQRMDKEYDMLWDKGVAAPMFCKESLHANGNATRRTAYVIPKDVHNIHMMGCLAASVARQQMLCEEAGIMFDNKKAEMATKAMESGDKNNVQMDTFELAKAPIKFRMSKGTRLAVLHVVSSILKEIVVAAGRGKSQLGRRKRMNKSDIEQARAGVALRMRARYARDACGNGQIIPLKAA